MIPETQRKTSSASGTAAPVASRRGRKSARTPGSASLRDSGNSHVDYSASMTRGGYRFTLQRREVYDALLRHRDHPTATDVFLRVKQKIPNISLATVYSCLETLTHAGLVRHVSVERGPARFCPNLESHGHFFCTECGSVTDIPLPNNLREFSHLWRLPPGMVLTGHEITLRGLCAHCAEKSEAHNSSRKPASKPENMISRRH